MLLVSFTTISVSHLVPLHLCYVEYDCTFKESLYSTYPYLTNSNKKSTLPVMTIDSTLGYREKIDAIASSNGYCGEEQR